MKWQHIPVMQEEVIQYLNIDPEQIYVDVTVGLGGHAKAIVGKLKSGHLIGIDADREALEHAQQVLTAYPNLSTLIQANFVGIRSLLSERGVGQVSGIFADLGVSSMELDNPLRGFGFQSDGPLDMRLDPDHQELTARDIVNTYREQDLAGLFREYGDEPFPGRIARVIVQERQKKEIRTTQELVSLIEQTVPYRRRGRIHPATRVFQALRIEVNDELNVLRHFIHDAVECLKIGGRLVIISFHSGEDRIVKHLFRELTQTSKYEVLTKKPVTPTSQEIAHNPRSRSAKMRVIQKLI